MLGRGIPSALIAMMLAGVASAQVGPLRGLDSQIEKMLADWRVPGLTLAVVRRDSVILAKGYGLREVGKTDRVDENTQFSIGSCSKAFASAAIANLVGDGKLRYDDRVIDWLPWFRTPDPWVTREMRVRDLMAHRTGYDLSDENRLWVFSADAKDLVVRTTREEPASQFRERYHYSNSMFSAAGLVVEAVSGSSFKDYAERSLFRPLNMVNTTTSARAQLAGTNYAIGHALRGADVAPEARIFLGDSLLIATGGVISTAHDMAQWLRFHLGRGRIGSKRLIDSTVFAELHKPHTPVRGGPVEAAYWFAHVDAADLQTRHWSYGLGWFGVDYRGRDLVWHGGTFNGYRCAIAFLPDEQVGMYVGVNRVTLLPPALMLDVIDRLTGVTGRDWNAIFLREAELQAQDASRAAGARAARVSGTKPSLPSSGYAGTFSHPAVGTLEVRSEGDQLTLTLGRFRARLEHWHYDTFRVLWDGALPPTLATFVANARAEAGSVRLESLGLFGRQP